MIAMRATSPATVGQQGPPARAAASDSEGSLPVARGPHDRQITRQFTNTTQPFVSHLITKHNMSPHQAMSFAAGVRGGHEQGGTVHAIHAVKAAAHLASYATELHHQGDVSYHQLLPHVVSHLERANVLHGRDLELMKKHDPAGLKAYNKSPMAHPVVAMAHRVKGMLETMD